MINEEKLKVILNWNEDFIIEEFDHTPLVVARGWNCEPFESLSYDDMDDAISKNYDAMVKFVWSVCRAVEKDKYDPRRKV